MKVRVWVEHVVAFIIAPIGFVVYLLHGRPAGVEALLGAHIPAFAVFGLGVILSDDRLKWAAVMPSVCMFFLNLIYELF